MGAGMSAIEGLDADDGSDHFRCNAIFRLGAIEGVLMRLNEGRSFLDALGLDENVPILMPYQPALRGTGHRLKHRRPKFGLLQCKL